MMAKVIHFLSDLSLLQVPERQASPPAEHVEEMQLQKNCSACHWQKSDLKEKEASSGDQMLSSIPSLVHQRG